jgi:ABC-type oligopeptide transport system ATPase subunit
MFPNFFPEKNGSFFSQQKATQALDDVRLSIAEGSFFGLFGSSGSGKTTLLQILTKRLFPDSGNVLFQNNNIFLQSRSEEQDFFPRGTDDL